MDVAQFFQVVKAGFSQRRKTILNALSAGLRLDRIPTAALLEQAGLAPSARAQTFSLEDWHRLTQAVFPPAN